MWTDRLALAFPITLIESANLLAAIIDPDTGGDKTFSLDSVIGDYVVAYVPFTAELRGVVERRNVTEWQAAIAQRATEFGREPVTVEEIEMLRSSILIGDEVAALEAA